MSALFVDHCLELLAPLGAVRARRMFGGHGLYVDELFIALIAHQGADQRLYLKVDAHSRAAFEAAGAQAFEYTRAGGQQAVMSYWSAPEAALESPQAMQPWARLALAAALRARAAPRARVAAAAPRASARAAAKKAVTPAARRATRR